MSDNTGDQFGERGDTVGPSTEAGFSEVAGEPDSPLYERGSTAGLEPGDGGEALVFDDSEEAVSVNGLRRILSKNPFLLAAWDDAKETSWYDKPLLLASAVGLWFNYGPGNEYLATKVGTETIKHMAVEGTQWVQQAFTGQDQLSQLIADHGNILLTSGATGLALATASMVYHGATGRLMVRNLRKFPEAFKVLQQGRLANSDFVQNSQDRSLPDRFQNSFFIGTDTVMVEDALTDETFLEDADTGNERAWSTTRLIAAGTFVLGAVSGGIAQTYINHGNPEAADRFLDVVGNPWLWLAGMTLSRGTKYAIRKVRRKREEARQEQIAIIDTTEPQTE